MISDRTANVVIWVALVGWAGIIVAGIFAINGYQSGPGINAIFTGGTRVRGRHRRRLAAVGHIEGTESRR